MLAHAREGNHPKGLGQSWRDKISKWRWAGLLLLLVVASFGCNPATALFFLFAPDPTFPPELIDLTKKKSSPKIVLMVSHARSDTQTPELWNADQLLARALHDEMEKRFKKNRQSVTIVPPHKLDEYKANHLNEWDTMSDHDIGKHFTADYVITMEIKKLSTSDPRTPQLMRGRSEILVRVTDVHAPPEQGPVETKNYTCVYPKQAPEPVDIGVTQGQFRARFIARMARELSRCFVRYPSDERFDMD